MPITKVLLVIDYTSAHCFKCYNVCSCLLEYSGDYYNIIFQMSTYSLYV